jgi:3-ketosteroid 9alpha-monooxygenase subunit B
LIVDREIRAPTPVATAAAATRERVRSLEVSAVVDETADARSIVFALPESDRALFAHRPGQFLTLRIPSELTGSVARSYSISSAPGDGSDIKVTVKRTPGGYASNWICDNVAVGMRLASLPPSGRFTPASLDADLLLCAAGSGITPMLSILTAALTRGNGRIVLYYANRHERSVIFADDLRRLAAEHPERLVVIHWLETLQGLPNSAAVHAALAPYAGFDSFVCGPGPFMDAATTALRAVGTPQERIHIEVFRSLTGDPFEDVVPAPIPTEPEDQSEAVGLEVNVDGESHALRWPLDVSLLDLLLANGIDADYSCREGECGSCVCMVAKGRVTMRRNDVLAPEELAEGYVLGCQSYPAGDGDVEIAL